MKQGRADRHVAEGRKVEPKSHSVHPGYADGLGQKFGNHVQDTGDIPYKTTPKNDGRGTISAPMRGGSTRNSGSQGKY